MFGRNTFHLYLHRTVTRVHVVELPHTAGTQVVFHFGVEVFIQMKELPFPAQEETEFIPSGILIVFR